MICHSFCASVQSFPGQGITSREEESVLLFFCDPGNQEACRGPDHVALRGVTESRKHQVGLLDCGGS